MTHGVWEPVFDGATHDTWALRSRRVVTPHGLRPASILIRDTAIAAVGDYEDVPDHLPLIDAADLVIMPGVIDTHVHFDEPGRTEWEGFATGTLAAAAGGVTTILDMPLHSLPPTTSRFALERKRDAAEGKCHVHVGFIGGLVPGNVDELARMADGGVRAFACTLSPSRVTEFPPVTESVLRKAFFTLADLGLPLIVHAENPAKLGAAPDDGSTEYATFLASRPADAEESAIALLVRLMAECPVAVHVPSLSSARSLRTVRAARDRGLPITVGTSPHYLTFAAQEIPNGATHFACEPPIRWDSDRDGLWRGLLDGEIDAIASGHSPCPPLMKASDGDFFAAWPGIASIELALPAVWTGARSHGAGVEWLVRWMCEGPARLSGVDAQKGRIEAGFDADLVVWDPDATFVVDSKALHQRHKTSPYAGRELQGVIHATYVCGQLAFGSV